MNQRGSILPLVAGLLALCGVVAVGVVDSTDLAISRTQLQSLADGAALAAAQSISPATAAVSGGRLIVTLTSSQVSSAARRFVADSSAAGVRVESATTPDRRTAVLTVTRRWRAPLISDFLPVRVTLTATARARTVFD